MRGRWTGVLVCAAGLAWGWSAWAQGPRAIAPAEAVDADVAAEEEAVDHPRDRGDVRLELMHSLEFAGVRSISAAPNGAIVVGAGEEGVTAWRVSPTGELQQRWRASAADLNAPDDWVTRAVRVSPDSRLVAIAIHPREPWRSPGRLAVVQSSNGTVLWSGETGYGPRAIGWLDNSRGFVVADEGGIGIEREPVAEGEDGPGAVRAVIDPPGSATIVRTFTGDWRDADPTTLTFTRDKVVPEGSMSAQQGRQVRVHPLNALTVELDFEPTGVATLGRIAYLIMPANNAIAAVDVAQREVLHIRPLSSVQQRVDAGPADGGPNVNRLIRAMPMSTGLALYRDLGGTPLLVTAGTGVLRGDLRDPVAPFHDHAPMSVLIEEGFVGERLSEVAAMMDPAQFGSLKVCMSFGVDPGMGLVRPHIFGSRSITIWEGTTLEFASDTEEAIESRIARDHPQHFNARPETPNEPDATSSSTGPELASIDVARMGDRVLAVSALRNPGGLAIADVTERDGAELVGLALTVADDGLGTADAVWVRWGGVWLVASAHETSGRVLVHRLVPTGDRSR